MPVLNNYLDEVIMFAQHTPGPWSCSWSLAGKWLVYIGKKVFSFDQEDEADARLIAAAPNLAFQLLAAANYIDALGGDSKSYRGALAEATGAKP